MKLNEVSHVYFIGIGGIGMSAIARYFIAQGKKVSGYDKTETVLTQHLSDEGMNIHYHDEISVIPTDIDLIIYTPAIPKDHKGYNHLLNSGIPMMKRSEALGLISNDKISVGIAGTHGKTTTSAMTTHVLKVGGIDVFAFLGGIAVDYNSNFLIGKSNVVVLEADEYDRSFLRLSPFIASISSMDADHLDIYGDSKVMIEGFKSYAAKIRDNGFLIIKEGLLDQFKINELMELTKRCVSVLEYGTGNVQIKMTRIRIDQGKYVFDYQGVGQEIKDIVMSMPGKHNLENACVAITVGLLNKVAPDDIKKALAGFKGIQRRFERIIDREDLVFIDDYAHHPSELKVAIDAARTLFPGRKLTGIFQPHLYSRTRDFVDGFAEELDRLDEIILMDIYPARELPIEGVTSESIFNRMKNPNKKLVTKETLMDTLNAYNLEILMTLGAGDIDTFVPKIKELYK
ncbi:MAG TPA: UDP-N-acetylmuramate--L-alanine ligase [Saprospiraceae bacterium]|nr:UDP-N-acetylmuramate--L-alanine ligase [Saprospiraceae bacterium]